MKHLFKNLAFVLFIILLMPLFNIPDNYVSSLIAAEPDYSFPNNNFPPEGAYVTPRGTAVVWPNGVLLKNFVQYGINPVDVPPKSGGSKDYVCVGSTTFELSFDQGGTWSAYSTVASNTFHLDYLKDSSSYNIHSGEVYLMNLSGGSMPPGILIRESPTQPSVGRTIWLPDGSRYKCDSFFDIYFEISTDGGLTFIPPNNSILMKSVSFYKESPSVVAPSTKFPPHGKYLQNKTDVITFPAGVRFKDFILRDFMHQGSLPDIAQPYNDTATADFLLSLDGGLTWSINHSEVRMVVQIKKIADSSGISLYEAEVSTMLFIAGPFVRFRESYTKKSTGKIIVESASAGYMISSFFDIFTEVSLDGGATWSPSDNLLSIDLTYPPAYPFLTNLMMPSTGYKTNSGDEISFASMFKIKSLVLNNFTSSFAPPALGGTSTNMFNGTANFDLSFDGGSSWSNVTAPASWQVRTFHHDDDGAAEFYEIEIMQLNISGGRLSPGVIIRESPTLKSAGRHDIVTTLAGYDVSSFFDIFTEISTDGGASFVQSSNYISCMLIPPCPTISITPESVADGKVNESYYQELSASGGTPPYSYAIIGGALPSGIDLSSNGIIYGTPNSPGYSTFTIEVTDSNGCTASGAYWIAVMPAGQQTYSDRFPQTGKYFQQTSSMVSFASGLVYRNLTLRNLSHVGEPPALYASQVYSFSATADLELSADGGITWTPYYNLPVSLQVNLNHQSDEGGKQNYLTEVLQFDITSIGGIARLRESPTLASKSKIIMSQLPDGQWHVESFFDIFTEVSVDGGATWSTALNKLTLNFVQPADSKFNSTNYFPTDAQFKSIGDDYIQFSNGYLLRKLLHDRFTQSLQPPPPLTSQTNSFSGIAEFELSIDGGVSWSQISAAVNEDVWISSASDDNNSRFFNTEFLSFSISGGTLSGGMQIRESPTKPSIGRYEFFSFGQLDYGLSSFFDIYFEITIDAGMTWSPSVKPFYILMRGTPVTMSVDMNSGWNMVSVPMIVDDYRTTVLYPTAKSPAYSFNGTYISEDTLKNMIGYWVKFSDPQSVSFTGFEITIDSVDVVDGWNMIGCLSDSVPVANITSDPPGIVTSQFFGFGNGYSDADTLLPGKGYWVKANQSGRLFMDNSAGGGIAERRIKIVPITQQPPLPPDGDRISNIEKRISNFKLEQNYPNPFNPETEIKYDITDESYVTIKVYNLLGEAVKTLVNLTSLPGSYTARWNAAGMPSGIYYYQMTIVDEATGKIINKSIKKAILLR
ncbi:MAG: T9SS type A sorting domain-containing protein [Ignavibacteriales bacterium]|nr:T9SS type A sorting domain-containing protein [Ignavibacteriales bacterium]